MAVPITAPSEVAQQQSDVAAHDSGGGARAAPEPARRRVRAGGMSAEEAKRVLEEPWDEAAEADVELPPLCVTSEDGSRAPLPGVLSLFLTGAREGLSSQEVVSTSSAPSAAWVLTPPPRPDTTCNLLDVAVSGGRTVTLSREAVLGDIQFRGAISDFHAARQAIADGGAESLVLRANDSDVYGDGNNYELAVSAAAVGTWSRAAAEMERRAARDARQERRRLAERCLPKSKRTHKVHRVGAQGVAQREGV